ncbi:hypothetical protein, partial [Clostridium sp.]|uniref:hypothetical protein n=1 Tax=Clostridium sp. TaxID=1506 RepID=UPI003463BEEF
MFSNLINTKDNLDKELYDLKISSSNKLTYDKDNPIEYFNEMENLIINEFNNLSETKEHSLKSIVHILQRYKEDFSSYYKTSRELSKVMEVPKEVLTMFSYTEYDDFKKLTSLVITNLKLLNSIKSNLSTSKNNSILEAINGISNMKKFKNLSIDINGETIDLDEIIITKKGIFVLKIFDFSLDDSIFIEVTNDGKLFKHQGMHKKLITKNFRSHLSNYCKFLEKNINEKIKTSEELNDYIKVYPLGVVINNNCKILNVSNIPLLKVNSLENHLSNYKDVLEEADLSLIYDIVSESITLKENKDFVSVDINTLEYLKIILVSSKVLKE